MTLQEKQSKADKIRDKARKDLYFFCKEILGYDKIHKQPHEDLCNFMTSEKKTKKLILMPRGSYKSTIITIGYALWRLEQDRNLRILISSETYAQSKTFLRAIKNHIEQNETFRAIFGDMCPKDKESSWRQDEIVVDGRTKVAREPSLMCSGIGQTKVGLHYDLIILDDVVSNKNINTTEQVQKTIDHYRLLLSILDPGKEITIVGTRYSYSDLYGHILEEEADNFSIHRRSAYREDGSLLFPSVLTKSYLEIQRKAMGANHFANQYLNQCVDDETAVFRKHWIKFYEHAPDNLRNFVLVDPASTMDKRSDFTGIVIVGIDPFNNIYVHEAIQMKDTIGNFVGKVFEKVAEYDVDANGCVGLETNANQQTYKYIFCEEMNKRGLFFAIQELKPSTDRSKANRIRSLQPYFENGKVWLKKDQNDLIDQIIMYPRTRHDDLIDALAYSLSVMSPADAPEEDKWEKSNLTQNEIDVWKERELLEKPRYIKRTKMRW